MKRIVTITVAFAAALVLSGCSEHEQVATSTLVLTNTVEIVREVVVTNVVTVTNLVVEKPQPMLSARHTAPYVVASASLDAGRLRKFLSDSGARVIECDSGSTALVEANEKSVLEMRSGGVVSAWTVSAEEKIAGDAGERVRVVPLSSIDLSALATAIRDFGGEVVQVISIGRPAIRAKLSYSAQRRLAERGDVRRIERDAQ